MPPTTAAPARPATWLQALLLITTQPSPVLREQEKWSQKFRHFLKCSLHLDPTKRASAEQLLLVSCVMHRRRITAWQAGMSPTTCTSCGTLYTMCLLFLYTLPPPNLLAASLHSNGVHTSRIFYLCIHHPARPRQEVILHSLAPLTPCCLPPLLFARLYTKSYVHCATTPMCFQSVCACARRLVM